MRSAHEADAAATFVDDGTPRDAPRTPSGLPASWDRYEILERLGEGGMGTVYKARDRRLGRLAAIKLIRGADPQLAMRFLREARAQARIEHPNVCAIHEVGEVEGRAYIALQLVEGEPIDHAAARMSLDEKVAALRDIARAIQEAHRHGVIHRDLKPGNILVERRDDGRWLPIVMDFGLARETTVELGLTRSGAVIGTPSYMSPEQARGDLAAIDRRSDVYGLGATLYQLLTGRPPFADASLARVLAQVIADEPTAPRRLVASLPIDLETVAMTCLAKDPVRRYASARALADDLDRYLAGTPIIARRASRWHRARLAARRHRGLVRLGAASLVLLAVVASLGVRAALETRDERARAQGRTALAQRLGQTATELALFLRTAYQLPLQDTRPERDLVRARMRIIAATPHTLGALGDAVVHEALGRGHLALRQWQDAADELARAAAAGVRTPELHAARGRALGELYHHALDEARRGGDPAWRAGRQRVLAAQYLAPALDELAHSGGEGEAGAYLEALIALYRRDFAAAETRALEAAARSPWLFEAPKLAGDAASAAAVEAFDRGAYEAARPGLVRAAALYAQASDVARSDASIYEAAARTWLQLAEIDVRQGQSPRAALAQAQRTIDSALRADPDDATAHTTKAYVLLRGCSAPGVVDVADRRGCLERVAAAAGRAVELDPQDASAWDALGNSHVDRGSHESYHGIDGTPWWRRAQAAFARALAIRPGDPWVHNDLGVAHRWIGTHLDETGQDPMPAYRAALRSYERATAIDPLYVYAWANQADLHATIAEHEALHGRDPEAAVGEARRAGEAGLQVDPKYIGALRAITQAEVSLAGYLVARGDDPSPALARATSAIDRAEALQPGDLAAMFYRATAARVLAEHQLGHAADPRRAIEASRRSLAAALTQYPGFATCHVEVARLALVEATGARRAGRDPTTILARARAHIEQAIAINPRSAETELVAAEVDLQLATSKRSPATVARGLRHVDAALALHPRLPHAGEVRAALARL